MRKTGKPFSALGLDHAHEQNNADIKSRGGAIGLTQNPSSLRRWTIGGPELTRILEEFENSGNTDSSYTTYHHEEYNSFQRKFAGKCVALKEAFLHFENPFTIDSCELLCLDTRVVIEKEGRDALYSLEEKGLLLYQNFVNDRLLTKKISIYNPIPKQRSKIFIPQKIPGPAATLKTLKDDIHLFSRLFIISTARDLDLKEFFRHENHKYPPSLSVNGEIRPGEKSPLTRILENLITADVSQSVICDGVVFDGASIVHSLKPKPSISTFESYCESQVKVHLQSVAKTVKAHRIDIAWDLYHEKSLKATTRENRGKGLRQHDLPNKGIV